MAAPAPERILAIQLRRLGDLILATASFRALKNAWPGACLTVVTEAPFDQVLLRNPDVDLVVLHSRHPVSSVGLGWQLSRGRFDLAIDFHGNPSSARLAAQSGAPVRIGWALRGRSMAYNRKVDVPPREPPRYTGDQKLDLVRAAGVDASDAAPRIVATPEDRALAAPLLETAGVARDEPFVVAAPASRRAYKEWLPEKFAAALREFRNASGARILLAGAASEEPSLSAVAGSFDRDPPPVLLVPSIRAWVGLIDRSALFFGPDGGAKHIAQGLGVSTLALFGPQEPLVWTVPSSYPPHLVVRGRRADCEASCSSRDLPCDCLSGVDPGQVAALLLSLWRRHPAAGRSESER